MATKKKSLERQSASTAGRWFGMSFLLTFVALGGLGSFGFSVSSGSHGTLRSPAVSVASVKSVNTACPLLAEWKDAGRENHPIYSAVRAASTQYAIDHELVVAIMATESNCKSVARSHRGARGIMQLMPGTARWLGVKDVDHVRENIMGGTKYLSLLLKEFKGDLPKAVAAYNSGPAAVRKYYGVPPYRETQDYVNRVMGFYRELQLAESLRSA